jgi:SAM-dependent methyltransferase
MFDKRRWVQLFWEDGKVRGQLLLEFLSSLKVQLAHKTVLDIGCGYGGVSLVMAENSSLTLSMDISKDMLSITKTRIKEQANLILASGSALPFKNDCVDLAILFGVFEFIPEAKPDANPEQTHLGVLKDVKGLLTKDGVLILGLENRYWLQYWFGMLDFHSGLRFVTVLPRRMADYMSRIIRKQNYLERLYSDHELDVLLDRAGFRISGRYTALPGWFYMDRIANLDNPQEFNEKIDSIEPWNPFVFGIQYNLNWLPKMFWKVLNKLGLLKLFCSNFIYLCRPIGLS